MIHLITEENKELKNRIFPLSKGIKKHLQNTLTNYSGDKTIDGYKRLNNLLNTKGGISYSEMKRIKNFFDNYQGTDKSFEFILNGGEPMKMWVNNTLYSATKAIHDFKQAKKDAGMQNAFIKTHEKDRQSKKKNKPTQVKFQTNNTNKNIKNNELLKFESKLSESKTQMKQVLLKLNEAQNEIFSLQELSNIRSFKNRYQYCLQNLGKPQGRGSSRVIFQLDDEKILKLAYNRKGVAQNQAEYDGFLDSLGVVPHTYDSDDNGLWLVSEYVLPAKEQDFQHCLNMSFEEFKKFIASDWAWRLDYTKAKNGEYNWVGIYSYDEYVEILENNEDLNPFDEYIGSYQPPLGDLLRLVNYGMTMRDGYPTIVLLDAGLSEEVWNNYYKQ